MYGSKGETLCDTFAGVTCKNQKDIGVEERWMHAKWAKQLSAIGMPWDYGPYV